MKTLCLGLMGNLVLSTELKMESTVSFYYIGTAMNIIVSPTPMKNNRSCSLICLQHEFRYQKHRTLAYRESYLMG